MNKKILRLLSMVLVLIFMVTAALPASVSAAPSTEEEIKQQIKTTYKQAKAYYGWNSFDGYCGALVNVQLYLLGITENVIGTDGRDAYDAFKNLKITNGGYSVSAYPAKLYTLKSALMDITENGTKDAYNILVGFEKTKSVLGRRYGHACMIHAIVDGTVYWMDSYDVNMNGVRYSEGTPLSASIADFAAYYASTTTQFDGVIYFGLKTYADGCTRYSSSAWGVAAADAQLWSQPCTKEVNESSESVRTLTAGEQLNITALYLNTEGEYWYEVDEGKSGYVNAADVTISRLRFDDVNVTDVAAPTVLVKGKTFSIKGTILSENNSIYSVRARVYSPDANQMIQIINATDLVQGTAYDLARSKVSNQLTFRSLDVGQYRYELAAIVANYYVEAGQLMTGWDTVILWSSDFLVLDSKTGVCTVSFDACGGSAGLNQTIAMAEQPVGALPVAQRPGHVFLGWFTEPEGGERITADHVITGDTTCYAQWISEEQLRQNWMDNSSCWYLYSDGISTMVCIELDGTLYYFSSMDPWCQGWMGWSTACAV